MSLECQIIPLKEHPDYDNPDDHLVRKLLFWRKSPSSHHRSAYDRCKNDHLTRKEALEVIKKIEHLDKFEHNKPDRLGYLHQAWLNTLPYEDRISCNLQIPDAGIQSPDFNQYYQLEKHALPGDIVEYHQFEEKRLLRIISRMSKGKRERIKKLFND